MRALQALKDCKKKAKAESKAKSKGKKAATAGGAGVLAILGFLADGMASPYGS